MICFHKPSPEASGSLRMTLSSIITFVRLGEVEAFLGLLRVKNIATDLKDFHRFNP